MTFSVVIPAYHSQATIGRAVASVLEQTFPAREIIIVSDDGKDYREVISHPIIHFVPSESLGSGPGFARNIGIAAATGRYIALLDADDAYHPERLEVMQPLVASYGAAFSNIRYLAEPTGELLPNVNFLFTANALGPAALFCSGIHTHGHIMFDKVRCPAKFDVSHAAQDAVFAAKLFDYLDVVGYTSRPLFDYYRNPESFCNSAGAAQKFLDFCLMLLDPQTPEHAIISRYKAFSVLKCVLESMRDAEIEVLKPHNVRSYQQIMSEIIKERLLPLANESYDLSTR